MSIHTGESKALQPPVTTSQSVAHSPGNSPGRGPGQAKIGLPMLSVPMSGATVNGLNPSWPLQADGWSAAKPPGSWDAHPASDNTITKSKDHQMPMLGLAARPTSYSAPKLPTPRPAQASPNRLSNLPMGKDSAIPHYPVPSLNRPTTNTQSYNSSITMRPYSGVPSPNSAHFDGPLTRAEDQLAVTVRGMVTADNQASHQLSPPAVVTSATVTSSPIRPSHPQIRLPFNGYVPNEFHPYFNPPPPFVNQVSQANPQNAVYRNIPPGGPPEAHHPSFFEFTAARPGSQFYYPSPQGMMFPSGQGPMLPTPQLAPAVPVLMGDKQRDLPAQFAFQQQMGMMPSPMMFNTLRSTPSPQHTHAFPQPGEFRPQLPLLMPPGSMYGHNPHPMFPHPFNVMRGGGAREGCDPVPSYRSALLEEFRSNRVRKWELADIFGHMVEFSGDQHGSRFIQQKLEQATGEEKQAIFDEILPGNALQLIQDVFGNYVIQKLFEYGAPAHKVALAQAMEGHLLDLSLQMYGCRVVQKAFECVPADYQAAFVRELEPNLLKCVKDANGNHVVQKIIERVSPDRLPFPSAFRGSVYELATHPYGCRVLQRCLEHLPTEFTKPLFDELHNYTLALMQDQFGNYVIQFVLKQGTLPDKLMIVSKLRGQLLAMSRHKFASNVCEKALTYSDLETRRGFVEEIYTLRPDGTDPIVMMMKDQYANYVLQTALAVAEGEHKDILYNRVRPHLMNMRRYSNAYNKHLVSIERLLEKYPFPVALIEGPNVPVV